MAMEALKARQKADTAPGFDVAKVRADFPILSERVRGKPLAYLDSANTSQKPQAVLDAMDSYYRHANANIHRARTSTPSCAASTRSARCSFNSWVLAGVREPRLD